MHMSVEQESVEQEAQTAVAQAEQTESAQEKQKAEAFANRSQESDQDRNWKETRRKMHELEKKAKEQEELIHRLTVPKVQSDDELDKLGDEDIVTKAQARKLAARMAEEIAQKVIKERDIATTDERLQLKYPDFMQVVTQENIEYLKQNEPELASSLSYISDPYAQGAAAYKMLKKLGKVEDPQTVGQMNKDKEKAIKNSQKPVSVQAVSKTSAIGNAQLFENGLTSELKNQLWKEMQQAMKG